MNKFIILYIVLISIIIFILTVKFIHDYVPANYYENINNMQGIATGLILAGAFIGFYIDSTQKEQIKQKEYIDNVIVSFDKIDDFLIERYEQLNNIIKFLYQNVNIPSSDNNLYKIYQNMSMKEKDILFIIYNKITFNLEKMYLLDPSLFDNNNFGMRVRLYIDNYFYYKYWINTSQLFKTEFVDFMNNKFDFLNFQNSKYIEKHSID